MQDRFMFTLNHLKEQFNNRLEIDTKEVVQVLDINASTLTNVLNMVRLTLPKYRTHRGSGKRTKKSRKISLANIRPCSIFTARPKHRCLGVEK